MTLIAAVCADGTGLEPSTVILPSDNMPRESDDLACMYNWSGSENGWITRDIWEQWVERFFIPEVVKRRARHELDASEKALLFLDSHASRLSERALALLNAANITMVTLPAHCSHIIQPLDCGIFNIFKRRLLAFKRQDFIPLNQGIPSYRRAVLFYARGAIHEAFSPVTIQKAWAQVGLWPWDPQRIINDCTRVTNVEIVPPKPSHPTATQAISGKVVTASDFEFLRLRKEAKEKLAEVKRLSKARVRQAKKLDKLLAKVNKFVSNPFVFKHAVKDLDDYSTASSESEQGETPTHDSDVAQVEGD